MNIAFFGSSLVSAFWNGAATYYRGILRALAERGHRTTFYEPDTFDRQKHRDIDDPPWATVRVYPATADGVCKALEEAKRADLIVKASGVGFADELLEAAVLDLQAPGRQVVFWDVDAPATLARVDADPADPFRPLIPRYDLVLTYGGGAPVIRAYEALGARRCVPIYNALDPSTHHPVPPQPAFSADLAFLGNRLPDREERVERFFFAAAEALPQRDFLLGGSGWDARGVPANVHRLGHVYTRDHNAFNCTPLAVLNINRESMARVGYSPPTRVFEAAGAAACLVCDAWEGIDQFLEPDREVLVAADGDEVARHIADLDRERAAAIGESARRRVLAEHTYAHRAATFDEVVDAAPSSPRPIASAPRAAASRTSASAGTKLEVVFLGLSITSSWGNGHATTYRGLVRELCRRGHDVLFLERDVPWYAENRDLPEPPYGTTELYDSVSDLQARFGDAIARADLVVVGSYVPDGIEIGDWVLDRAGGVTAFYDIDTPVTLARLDRGDCDYLRADQIARYQLYLSFTGGPTLERLERELSSPCARALYCSADPSLYAPDEQSPRWDLGYMGTHSDDRQPGLERLLIEPARRLPEARFVVAGPQYPPSIQWPGNVERIEHLPPPRHAAFYNACRVSLNLTRGDMVRAGYSPSVRLFEAAACGVPIASDVWPGIESVFVPGEEILLVEDTGQMVEILASTDPAELARIGVRARRRVLAEHTAAHRAEALERFVAELAPHPARRSVRA